MFEWVVALQDQAALLGRSSMEKSRTLFLAAICTYRYLALKLFSNSDIYWLISRWSKPPTCHGHSAKFAST